MQIYYCDLCGARVTTSDLDRGHGVRIGEACFCRKCAREIAPDAEQPTRQETQPRQPSRSTPAPRRRRGVTSGRAQRTVPQSTHRIPSVSRKSPAGPVIVVVLVVSLVAGYLVHSSLSGSAGAAGAADRDEVFSDSPLVSHSGGRTTVTVPSSPDGGVRDTGVASDSGAAGRQDPPAFLAQSGTDYSPGLQVIGGAPTGAVFFAGFEPADKFVTLIRDEPLEYAPGIPGRAIGVTREKEQGVHTSIRYEDERPIARLTSDSVIVAAVRSKYEPVSVYLEVNARHAPPDFYYKDRIADPAELEWRFYGMRLGDMDGR